MKNPINDSLKIMLLYITISVTVVILISGGINNIYSKSLQNAIIHQKETELTNTAIMINQLAGSVVTTSNMLVLNDEFLRAVYMQESGQQPDSGDYYQIINSLQKYKATSEFVAGITIVDRNNMKTVSENGVSSFEVYFGSNYKYEQYPIAFWRDISAPGARYKALSMTYKHGVNKMVIPIIFNGIMNASSSTLVIIDLDCEVIQNKFLTSSDAQNSIYLFDTETNNQIGSGGGQMLGEVFAAQDFTDRLKKEPSFTYKMNGERYLVVSSNENQLLFNKILFVSITPLEHIMRDTNRIKVISFIGYFLSVLLLMYLAAYYTKRFYKPLKWIVNRVGTRDGAGQGTKLSDLDVLKANIDEMLRQNTSYKQQMSTAMPLACDRYIEKFLKSQDAAMVDEFEEFMAKSNIRFEKKYFAIASVKVRFTEKFYQQFTSIEHKNVIDGILDLLSSAVGPDNTLYILPVHDENYLLIVNLSNDTVDFNQMVERINQVAESFDDDIAFIKIEISFGEPYGHYEGMRKSYHECINGSYKLNDKSGVWVSRSELKEYQYNINDENRLFNTMVKGDETAVEQMIREIINKSIETGIGYQQLRDLYLQIYNTAQKVITTKNITEKVLMGEEYINVRESVELMDNDHLFEYIRLLVREATVYNNAPDSKLNLEEIANFINENYAQEIYLEMLAEKYGTSVKYLSRILKNYFGVSYVEYLGRVRIEHAKEYLEDTNLSVNDIMLKCGFNSRNTFIRAFKKYAGIVPSEYRNIYGKKERKNKEDKE